MSDASARSDIPLPPGFRLEPDRRSRELAPGVWLGGQPARVLRLTAVGRRGWAALRGGAPIADPDTGRLARRLIDAGLAHPLAPVDAGTPPRLTVVVPVRDRAEELRRCLAGLDGRFPVVVVDDGSRDAAAVAEAARRHDARLVRLAVNAGPAAARNAGLAAVDTELVAFADSDTEPSPRALTELAAQLADPLVAAAAPRVRAVGDRSSAGRYVRARGSLDLGPAPARPAPYTSVSYVPTASLVARVATLRAVGDGERVFDPALRYGEDVDLVWRLLAAGHRVRYVPSTTVAHHDPTTWRQLLGRRFRYGTSAAALARRHPDDLAPLVLHPWYSTAALAALAGHPLPAGLLAAGALAAARRSLRAAGLPADAVRPRDVGANLLRAGVGLARYAGQFGAPVLLAGLGHRRTRVPALALLLLPGVDEWCRRRPDLDPARFVAAVVADECAYGAGVICGCLTHRSVVALRPRRTGGPARARRPPEGDEHGRSLVRDGR